MLKTVFARAGSDREKFICESIKESLSADGRKVMLLIPEQSSFESEKQLYFSLGDLDFSRVEVVSFTNLCRLVKRLYGSDGATRLSSAGKVILSSCAAEKCASELKVYSSQASNAAFSQRVSSIIDELKIASLSAKAFEEKLKGFPQDSPLYSKLSDISAIYNWYDALLSNSLADPSDELSAAILRLSSGQLFENYDIIINEFSSFNNSQLEVIKMMLRNSPKVTLILTADEYAQKGRAASFKMPLETYRKIRRIAKENAVEILSPVKLETALYENDDLVELERLLAGEVCNQVKGDNIKIFCAPSVKKECRFVAANIHKLVREEGYRYKDIAVVGRDIEGYMPYIDDSLRLYNIPFFADARASIDTRPIVVLIVSLIETIISSFEPSRLISYLKCPISPIDADDAAKLENYIELWRISPKELLRDFEKNPQGLAGEMDERTVEELCRLNEIRKTAIEPLLSLRKEVLSASGGSITRSIYNFLSKNGILKKLSDYTKELSLSDNSLAAEQHRAFEVCLDAMSQIAALMENESVTLKRYLEIFKMAINASDVGSVPHHLDEVMVASADRMRPGKIRAVFLVGVNEGVFPQRHSEDGIFSDADRKAVRRAGIDILTPSGTMNENEYHYLYNALTCASARVFLSYPLRNLSGETALASKVIANVKDKLGVEEIRVSAYEEALLGTDESAFELLCNHYNENTAFANSLREYFMCKANSLYRERLLSIDKGLRNRNSAIGEDAAQSLYGDEMMISPSQIEKYHLCKFAHFCRYGLSLNPLKKAEVTAMDSGNAIHAVMEKLLRDYTKEEICAFSDSELTEKVQALLCEFLSEQIGSSALIDNRTKYSIMRLRSTVIPVVKYVISELQYSGFTPQDLELEIRRGRDLEPYRITSEGGTKIGVHGKVDRVDIKKTDDKTYVRVIDYKSGGKNFSRDELSFGLNLQMFLYLFSIWENGGKRYGQNITPSGVLYMPAKRPDVEVKGSDNEDSINSKSRSALRMNGIILDDEEVKKEDTIKYCSVSSGDISEFAAIKNQTEKLLCKMADELKLGNLSINPLYVGRENRACKYCDFKMICGFEEGDPCNKVEKSNESEVQ